MIRRATVDDLPIVIELRLALLREHCDNPMYSRIRPDAHQRARPLFASQLSSPTEITLLAERDGVVIGILRCIDAAGSPLLDPPRYGYVTSAYVLPAERRTGVLSALFAHAERWSLDRGLTEMRLHSTPENEVAGAAWDALGFEVVEQLRFRRSE